MCSTTVQHGPTYTWRTLSTALACATSSGHGYASVPAPGGGGAGNYQLQSGTRGADTWQSGAKKCDTIPNFSDGYLGNSVMRLTARDHQMRYTIFGVHAEGCKSDA